MESYKNPFRPGAGHLPPYLAGREEEKKELVKLLEQEIILENLILTGLRGVGKTVLLETFKPTAMEGKWLWVGTDLSESASISEDKLALRILTDLSVVTSAWPVSVRTRDSVGFVSNKETETVYMNFSMLNFIYEATPGLPSDKLKNVLEKVWEVLPKDHFKGIVFAYDEAQNLFDHAEKHEYALSMLLDVFQSIQRKQVCFMLMLAGLPTLFPNLVEARTYSERMFRVLFLDKLGHSASREAILKPIEISDCPVRFNENSVETIIDISGGYPYFIQFICKEVFDFFIQQNQNFVPVDGIVHKLDSDFFAGRWARTTDRQKDLLTVAAKITEGEGEFSVQDVVTASKSESIKSKSFSNSHVNQILSTLIKFGLVYKNRHGKYCFAVPLLGKYILRQKWANS